MAKYSTSNVYVVTWRHSDRYSFDTGPPDELFTSQEEANNVAEMYNASAKKLSFYDGKDHYFVETLTDRIEMIREECRNEGRQNGNNAG